MGNNVFIGTKTGDCYGKLFMIGTNGLVTKVIDWSESNGEIWSLAVVGNNLYIGTKNYNENNNYQGKLLFKKIK